LKGSYGVRGHTTCITYRIYATHTHTQGGRVVMVRSIPSCIDSVDLVKEGLSINDLFLFYLLDFVALVGTL